MVFLTGFLLFVAGCRLLSVLLKGHSKSSREMSLNRWKTALPGVINLGVAGALAAGWVAFTGNRTGREGLPFADGSGITIPMLFTGVVTTFELTRRRLAERILIMGDGNIGRKITQEASGRSGSAFELVGFLCPPEERQTSVGEYPVLGSFEQLPEIVRRQRIDRIVLCIKERRRALPIKQLLEAKISGIQVEEGTAFYERIAGKVLVAELRPSDMLFTGGVRRSAFNRFNRRAGAILLSLLILLLSLPVLVLVAVLIKIESRGPILFKQERVGGKGKRFKLLKFRSMEHEAENDTGPIWAEKEDPRVTRVGRFMRKTRIDEIPQVVNVLKGDMELIGPRPERPYFVELLEQEIPYYTQRLTMKPGITGLAQIRYPYGSTVEDAVEKLQYDLYYIKNMSLRLDAEILFETVKTVLFCEGQ